MADLLKVSPQELRNASQAFTTGSTTIKGITDNMLAIANDLKSVWTGEASASYCAKLNDLGSGMTTMNNKINKQAENLMTMAGIYESAENNNVQIAGELRKEEFV